MSWDLKIYRCLKVAVGMLDNSRYRYALATINPKSTAFGGYQETFLCFNNKVLTVTFVGRVISTFFFRMAQIRDPRAVQAWNLSFYGTSTMRWPGDYYTRRQILPSVRSLQFLVSLSEKKTLIAWVLATTKKMFWARKKCTVWKAGKGSDGKGVKEVCFVRIGVDSVLLIVLFVSPIGSTSCTMGLCASAPSLKWRGWPNSTCTRTTWHFLSVKFATTDRKTRQIGPLGRQVWNSAVSYACGRLLLTFQRKKSLRTRACSASILMMNLKGIDRRHGGTMYKCVFVSLVVQISSPFVVRHHRFRLHLYTVIHLVEYRCDCQ